MSTRNAVYKLEKELAFWRRVHEHEPMDEREFKLERQIRQLANPDEFGISRYNGHIEDDDDEDEYEYVPRVISCRYCGKTGSGSWHCYHAVHPVLRRGWHHHIQRGL